MPKTSGIYILNNGPKGFEAARLDVQHQFLMKVTERLLPRNVSAFLSEIPEPRIADVGTGTGSWLQTLSERLPSTARLDGYDLDTTKFPPPCDRPANLSLEFGDILSPFATELQGTYDLAHVRLVGFVLKKDEWVTAAKNVMALLRPGGILFWEEAGHAMWSCMPPSMAFTEYVDVDARAATVLGRDLWQAYNLKSYLSSAGLTRCREAIFQSMRSTAPGLAEETKQEVATLSRQLLTGVVALGGIDGMRNSDDIEKLHSRLVGDMYEEGCQPSYGMSWVWGMKPVGWDQFSGDNSSSEDVDKL